MKNVMLLLTLLAILCSCTAKTEPEEPSDKWNGYFKYLKQGEVVHTLWAGQHTAVGTVTYGLDDQANFYVTYQCDPGWLISESHMFAGDKRTMPLNKPGSPKVGRFPYSSCHRPRTTTVTYTVPLVTLPPAEEPGFVVASHCVVHGPCGRTETAWAEGDFTFCDKGWGWYDIYFFNQEQNTYTLLYGTQCGADSLVLYMVDTRNAGSLVIYSEHPGTGTGPFDGAAYDAGNAMLFYVDRSTGMLWINRLEDSTLSFPSGVLPGIPAGGSVYEGAYFYVNTVQNTIDKVVFDDGWSIAGHFILATIPLSLTVNDLAVDPSGSSVYILGDDAGGNGTLLVWNIAANTFSTALSEFDPGSQLAFGADGELYVAAGSCADSSASLLYTIDLENFPIVPVKDTVVVLDDPFSDLSSGPVM